jgi:hypothetical protein
MSAPGQGGGGARKPPLAPTFSALIRRPGETGVASDRFVIAPAAREHLVDQHVRRLDTDPKDSGNQANHRGRAVVCGGSCHELAQAFALDDTDLLAHDAKPREMAAQLRARVL